ncbi:CHAD domain-containing protein [Photobacterium japonica]|uniref:CHAD domain-containing protein n=1 Tax=Photobacterium japonica TaxID=2910235 RepID=UPI003D111FCF
MSVTKRDQLTLPKRKSPCVILTADTDITLATYHYLTNEFHHACRHEAGMIRDDDEEFLHQYRVALRRCRALIGLLGPLFEKRQKVMLKLALRTLMQHTNTLRDLDVFLMKMEDYFFLLEHPHHNGLTRFFDDLQYQRRKRFKTLKRWLKSNEYQQHCTLISGLLDELSLTEKKKNAAQPSTLDVASKVLVYHSQRVNKHCDGISPSSPDTQLHQLRIDCKKFRYVLEYFAPLYPNAKSKHLLAALKQLQTSLGDLNDLTVQQTFLNNYLYTTQCMDMKKAALETLIAQTHDRYAQRHAGALEQIAVFRGHLPINHF